MKQKPTKEQVNIFNCIEKTNDNILIKAYAGCGKCLGFNTPVLMFDGKIKMVQDIVSGDLIMGDDSSPRKVLGVNVGFGELYNVIPEIGDSWVCNDVHVMTHYNESMGKLVDIPLNEFDYDVDIDGYYSNIKLQKTGVEFMNIVDVDDSYLLGSLIGDSLMSNYEFNEIFKIKIPDEYLVSSVINRRLLLCGLLNSCGVYSNGNYIIKTKHHIFSEDILFLCRSLGFNAYKTYDNKLLCWVITLYGRFSELRLLNNNEIKDIFHSDLTLRVRFKTEYLGQGHYYGFTLDGNGRFLLGDFTITHNTSTIVAGSSLIPDDKRVIFLAYNKHIQNELKEKLLEKIKAFTTYGLGYSALMKKYKNEIVFDDFKVDKIIQKKSNSWDLTDFKNQEAIDKYLKDMKKMVNICRLTLTLKHDTLPFIAKKYGINFKNDVDYKRVLKILDASTTDRKTFDYVDMVYLPAVDNSIWMFPYDVVIVDECQDLNRCQIKIIEKIVKKDKNGNRVGRVILIGDQHQSIYGFNGSDTKSFEYFNKYPDIKTFPLSTSFRCAKNIINKAKEIVPNINALENAPDGIVRDDGDVINEARDGDFVLCRKTLPLVKLFFKFLVKGKRVTIKGADIGLNLLEMIGRFKTLADLIVFWESEVRIYRDNLINSGIINPDEHNGYVAFQDKVDVLVFLSKLSNDVSDLKEKIGKVFPEDGNSGIVLMTIHKSKGLEADRVFIIRPDLIPLPGLNGWEYEQEKNLEYVAYTRAKNELIIDKTWND